MQIPLGQVSSQSGAAVSSLDPAVVSGSLVDDVSPESGPVSGGGFVVGCGAVADALGPLVELIEPSEDELESVAPVESASDVDGESTKHEAHSPSTTPKKPNTVVFARLRITRR